MSPRKNAYLNWVETSQMLLSAVFTDSDVADGLLSRGYWHICNMQLGSPTADSLIGEELIYQASHANIHDDAHGRLGQAVARLRALLPLASRDGQICVPDTNALLHFTRFDQLDWSARIGVPLVRLVIPMVVVTEIDNKKYARRGEFWELLATFWP